MNIMKFQPTKKWSRIVFILASVVTVISLLSLLFYSWKLNRDQEQHLIDAQDIAKQHAEEISVDISDELNGIRPLVTSLVDELNGSKLTKDELNNKLKLLFDDNKDASILEVGVAFSTDSGRLQNAPHYGAKNGLPRFFQVEDSYNYIESAWYKNTMKNGSGWIRPYFGKATQAWTAGYAMCFYNEAEKITTAGVARINFRLDKVRQHVSSHRVGNTGYAFLYTTDGTIMTHPIEEYIGKSIGDIENSNAVLKHINNTLEDNVINNTLESYEVNDMLTDQSYWVYSKPFENSNWHVGVVFSEREAMQNDSDLSSKRAIVLSLVMFALSVLLLVSRAYVGKKSSLWVFSVSSSVIFILGIFSIWYLHLDNPYRASTKSVRVVDKTSAEVVIANYRFENNVPLDTTIARIPTGLFIQSLRFTSANNVVLTGYVWQRCSNTDCNLSELTGVIFPEAESVSIKEAFTGPQIKGWYFETTLRQQFSYLHYPFDREDVWIRLWPNNFQHFERTVVLVPDFMGYNVADAKFRPGLEQEGFVLDGWELLNSYFSYRQNPYNVNFGYEETSSNKSLELYFNIGMKRNFVSPFITDMIPIIVVSFLVFSVLMISTKDRNDNQLFGFNTSNVLSYCAALFFVVIVAHVHLREVLAAKEIIYLEYFYFLMYFVILIISTNALLFVSKTHIPIIDYEDNLILKLIYWPILIGGAFVITSFVF